MEEKAKISVIMPAFNCEKYIREAIESVRQQTYSNWELIVVDDGSTDGTANVVNYMIAADDRIKIIRQENQGVVSARKQGIRSAKGEFLSFIDADDKYPQYRLQIMMDAAEQTGSDFVWGNYMPVRGEMPQDETITSSSQNEVISSNDFIAEIVFKHKFTGVTLGLYRTDLIRQVNWKDLGFAEDYFFVLDYVSKCNNITKIDNTVYYYRRDNEDSITLNMGNVKYVSDYAKIPEYFAQFLHDNKINDRDYFEKLGYEYVAAGKRIIAAGGKTALENCVRDKGMLNSIASSMMPRVCSKKEKVLYLMLRVRMIGVFAFLAGRSFKI